MTCIETRPLLDAYFDNELDLSGSLGVQHHVTDCATCSAILKNLDLLRAELAPEVFDLTRKSTLEPLRTAIRKVVPTSIKPAPSIWSNPILYVAAAAAFLLAVIVPSPFRDSGTSPTRQIVDSHLRSLMVDHLVDVPSSDQHTVKPWFQGKLDFAPEVPDLTDKGFALIGGRIDVINGHPVAAVVYKKREHFVNLFTAKTQAGEASPVFSTMEGYQVVHWIHSGADRWVTTDLNQAEVQTFVGLIRNQ